MEHKKGYILTSDDTGTLTLRKPELQTLEFVGDVDVTSNVVPANVRSSAAVYVNTGSGKFSPEWLAVTDGVDANTEANPGDFMMKDLQNAGPKPWTHVPSGIPESDGLWIENGTNIHPLDTSNNVLVGGTTTGNATIQLNADGSANFANGNVTVSTGGRVLCYTNETGLPGLVSVNKSSTPAKALQIGNSSEYVIDMFNDGSAKFASDVTVAQLNLSSNDGWGAQIKTQGNAAYYYSQHKSDAHPATPYFEGYRGAEKFVGIYSDGSASFASRVAIGSADNGATQTTSYAITAYNNSSTTETIYARNQGDGPLFRGRDSSNNLNVDIGSNGSATFAGNVGIGTDSPNSFYANQLVVNTGSAIQSGITIVSESSNQGMFAFADGKSGSARYAGYVNYDHSQDSLSVGTNAQERLSINSSGDITASGTITAGGFRIDLLQNLPA